jgi:Tfp pilus assembly protein PilF
MQQVRCEVWKLVLFGLAVSLTGCGTARSRWTDGATQPTSISTAARPAEKSELPPAETGRLCLATAQSMDREGRAADAIPLYVKARQLDPAQAGVCRRLAVLYDRVGDFAHAGREYQEALRLAPRDPSLYNDIGYSCYCQGRFNEADQFLRKAVELDPKQDRSWVNLGLVLAMQSRYGDALRAFEKAVPESQALCNVAFIQTVQGKREDAANSYRTALRLSPDLPLARAALAKLEAPPGQRPAEVVTARAEATPPSTTQPVSFLQEVDAPTATPTRPAAPPVPSLLPPMSAYPRLAEPTPIARSGFMPMPWETASPIQPVGYWVRPGRQGASGYVP